MAQVLTAGGAIGQGAMIVAGRGRQERAKSTHIDLTRGGGIQGNGLAGDKQKGRAIIRCLLIIT